MPGCQEGRRARGQEGKEGKRSRGRAGNVHDRAFQFPVSSFQWCLFSSIHQSYYVGMTTAGRTKISLRCRCVVEMLVCKDKDMSLGTLGTLDI